MQKTDIITFIIEGQNHILRIEGIKREYEEILKKSIGSKPIKIITGFRRSGKSFLVQRVARNLIEENLYKISNILYLNFEDFRLSQINTPEKLHECYKTFRTNIADQQKKLLIFDEIQNVTQWDRFIRTIYEMDSDIEIIITGSNSELLSSELGSNLAGRFIEFSILPFDFKEYLRYKDLEVSDITDYYRNQEKIQELFYRYLKFGGLPEALSINNNDACFSYLEGIVSKVILDDIIKRFTVRHALAVEKILSYLFSNIGNFISFRKLSNYLETTGINIKQETLIRYVQFMLKTFALYEINKFDWKAQRLFPTSRKYYAVDTGLVNLYPSPTGNFSKQLENIVFLKLKKLKKPISFGTFSSGKEIDFILQLGEGIFEKYQVTQQLHKDNYERELSPFLLQDQYLSVGENILLTLDIGEEKIDYKGIKIFKRNILTWLLFDSA
ncbi:MAG: ATP-binding protein [bacterium]